MKKRILVDMDGVLADFDKKVTEIYKEKFPERDYIPLENKTTFYLSEMYPKQYKSDIEEISLMSGFFKTLEPVEGSLEALMHMDSLGHEIFICTAPISGNKTCASDKFEWVYEYLGKSWIKKVVIAKDKTIISGDYLIDDKPQIEGVEKNPSWEHILYDQPYNQCVNKRRLTWKNYKEVLNL